ncbi:Glucose-fructose oxidoreductase domain-containing protein 1 [Saguinus oedipus]|nr:Glucose-fructose oxidoreductase domain-containing protein 1 [Saguinus oedipus]
MIVMRTSKKDLWHLLESRAQNQADRPFAEEISVCFLQEKSQQTNIMLHGCVALSVIQTNVISSLCQSFSPHLVAKHEMNFSLLFHGHQGDQPSSANREEKARRGIGKNVICDRTATPLDAFRMTSAAHYYPKLMSIMGNVLRFLPAFVRMKQLIEEGYVGEPLVCEVQVHGGSLLGKKYNWSCDDLMGGGGLHSVGTYIIDLLTFLTGQKAVKVHGLLKTFVKQTDHIKGIRQITSDDFCTFQMVLEGGVCCTVTLNFNVPGEFKQDVTVVGSAGRLLAVGTDLYGQRNSAPEQELLVQDATPVSNSLLPEKAFSDIPSPYLRGTIKMMQAVRQAFQDQDDRRTWDGRPLTMAATFDDCLYALCVVDTIKRSSQTGEWQNIAIMTEEPELSPAYLISEAMRRSRMSLYC